MRITLVMPNYNHAAYLAVSIGGMLAQSRPADEIIIIDDASTDGSLALLRELIASDPRIRLVCNRERRGVVAALNAGLEMATGDLIAFLGADDIIFPEFLAIMEKLLLQCPDAAFCCARAELHDRNGRYTGERPILRPARVARFVSAGETRRQLATIDNFFLAPVTLYRRDRLLEMGGFDGNLGSSSDGILQRRMAVRWGYAFSPALLGGWRIHGHNYSSVSATDPERVEQIIASAKSVIEGEPPGLFPPNYAETYERRLRFNSGRLMMGELRTDATIAGKIGAVIRGSRIDRGALAAAGRLGPFAGVLGTAWLALRLRPFGMGQILAEGWHRTLDRLGAGARRRGR